MTAKAEKELSSDIDNPTDLSDVRFPNVKLEQVHTRGLHDVQRCRVVFFNPVTEQKVVVDFDRGIQTGEYFHKTVLIPKKPNIDLTRLPKCFVKDIVWDNESKDDKTRKSLFLMLG